MMSFMYPYSCGAISQAVPSHTINDSEHGWGEPGTDIMPVMQLVLSVFEVEHV